VNFYVAWAILLPQNFSFKNCQHIFIFWLNNLAVTESVVSAFREDICLKAQKIPYFGAAVPKYAK
jgi:hypothetical protein